MSTPKLPSLRELTRQLRALHAAWQQPGAGGEYVCLCVCDCCPPDGAMRLSVASDVETGYGREFVPGSVPKTCAVCSQVPPSRPAVRAICPNCKGEHVPSKFDAPAAARRLLAAARDAV